MDYVANRTSTSGGGLTVADHRPAVAVEHVSKRFGSVDALSDVSVRVDRGEVLGLLGPNGAGKTTLVRVMATLTAPDAGCVLVDGFDAADDAEEVRRRIGLAGQFAAVDEMLTGRENLILIGRLYGLTRDSAKDRADRLLRQFGLEGAAGRRAGTYSGGMRRKLDLGATLMGAPSVLLLDEPTAGLDPRVRNDVWRLVDHIAAAGTTVVLTSQHLDEIERLASRVLVLDRGRVIAEGTASELKHRLGGHVLDLRLASALDVEVAAKALSDDGRLDVSIDAARLRVTAPADGRPEDLAAFAATLERADVRPVELGMRLPLLDDVFMALTGAVAADGQGPASSDFTDRSVRTDLDGPLPEATQRSRRALGDVAAITHRFLLRLVRTPQLLFFGTVQPVLFVLGLSAVFGGLVEQFLGGDYIQYLLPGVMVMNLILMAGTTGVGVAQDMQAGVIDRFLSLPMARTAVLAGRTFTDLVRNTISISLMVVAGFALGYRVEGSVASALAAFLLALLFSYSCTWLFAWIGLVVRDPQTAQFAGFAPVLPLVYLSGAWVPVDTMAPGIRSFARNQPVNVAVEAVRSLAADAPDGSAIAQALAWSLGLLIVFSFLATRRYTRAT